MDSNIWTCMAQLDAAFIVAAFALCYLKTSTVEVDYFVRILLGSLGMLLSYFLAAWSINGSLFDVLDMILDSSLGLFFFVLSMAMLLFVVFQAVTYIQDKTVWAIEDQERRDEFRDLADLRDKRDLQDTRDLDDTGEFEQ